MVLCLPSQILESGCLGSYFKSPLRDGMAALSLNFLMCRMCRDLIELIARSKEERKGWMEKKQQV